MNVRPYLYGVIAILLFSSPAIAKIRDFQFIEDLTFTMPGEVSFDQGMNNARSRRFVKTDAAGNLLNTENGRTVVPTNIAYGVSEKFELSLEVPYVFLDNTVDDYNGVGDIGIRQKMRLSDQADGKAWISSALGLRFEAPTGDMKRGLGNGKSDVELFGIGMKEAGIAKFLVNLGYNFVGGEKYANEFKYSAGVNAIIHPGFSFLMEFSGVAGTKDERYLAPGFLFEMRGMAVRFGTQFGISRDSYKYRWNFSTTSNS